MVKAQFFDKNHGLEKFDFSDVFETSLSCSKKFSFLSRILENDFFLPWSAQKNPHGNKLDLISKKYSFLSRI